MKHEFSAGGIVYRRESTLTDKETRINANNVEWLVCQHSMHKGWVFPKGLIGDKKSGEPMEEAAVRETEEETGIKAKIIVKLPKPTEYFYKWDKELIKKTVYYFLMEYLGGDIENHDEEMQAVEWLPTEEVEKRLTYKADKKAFKEALTIFNDVLVGDK